MARTPKKTAANDASKSLKETEKRIRAVEKQIKATGRLRNPKTGAFIKVTGPNIKKVEREILKDVKQSKRTLKAASKFVDTIKGFFKEKKASKRGAVKPSKKSISRSQTQRPTASTKPSKKSASPHNKTSVHRPSSKGTKKPSPATVAPKTKRRKSPTDNPRQRIYEVSELPEAFRTATANDTLEMIEENAADYNALLKPGDVFGGKVGYVNKHGHFVGGYTHHIFTTIEDYIKYMQEYRVLKQLGDSEEDQYKVLDLLKIIRFKASKKVYGGKGVPSFMANTIGWSQMTLSYNRKKAESKKAFKKKMKELDKQRSIKEAHLRGRVSALEIENKLLREGRIK